MTKTKKNKIQFNDFEIDQLQESINIGVSHASTALSQLIKKRVNISVPEARIAKVKDPLDYIDEKDKIATAVIVKILGEASGSMVFVFPGDNGFRLARLIIGGKSNSKLLTQEDCLALSEVSNILSGACLSAFSQFLNINMLHSVSRVVTDLLGAIVEFLMTTIHKSNNIALIFKANMTVDQEAVTMQMFFLMDEKLTKKILNVAKKSFTK